MRRSASWTLCVLLASAWPSPGAAQLGFALQAGASIPFGDYADDSGNKAGLAVTHLTGHLEVSGSLSGSIGIDWLVTAGASFHGVDDELADDLVGGGYTDVSVGRYLIAPGLAGVRWRSPFGQEAAVWLFGQGGVALIKAYTLNATAAGNPIELEHDWAYVPAFAVGGGLDVNDRLGFGVRFVPLGEVELEGQLSTGEPFEFDQPISYLDVFVRVRIL